MKAEDAAVLLELAAANLQNADISYDEKGFDSCQSVRAVSKVCSELICTGGHSYESDLLGLHLNISEVQEQIGSSVYVPPFRYDHLKHISATYGAKQDFLFPGITPTDETTPSVGQSIYDTARGNPPLSVRTLNGMGGFRYDRNWNCVADLSTYAELKIAEDKRYYPGLGVYHFLTSLDPSFIPAMVTLYDTDRDVYERLASVHRQAQGMERKTVRDVGVLSTGYIPPWHESKQYLDGITNKHLELSESFHSPSYDFVVLKKILERHAEGKSVDDAMMRQIAMLKGRMNHMLTFNSPIHLPWAAELSDMSYGLIGKVTNAAGDFAVRYGISHEGKSLEVREYHYGSDRRFPYGVAGSTSYGVSVYPDSDQFKGPTESLILYPDDPLWQSIEKGGFIKSALHVLNTM